MLQDFVGEFRMVSVNPTLQEPGKLLTLFLLIVYEL